MRLLKPTLLALLSGLAVASLSAQTVTIYSDDFQSYATGTESSQVWPTGWLQRGGTDPQMTVFANPSQGGLNTSSQVLFMYHSDSDSDIATTAIDLTNYKNATNFTLSFDLYEDTSATNTNLIIGFYSPTQSMYRWVVKDFDSGLSGVDYTINPTAMNTWQHYSVDVSTAISPYLTALSGEPLTDFKIRLQNYSGGFNTDQNIYLDNLQLTATAVPEPSTYAIFAGLAVLALAFWHRRRRAA